MRKQDENTPKEQDEEQAGGRDLYEWVQALVQDWQGSLQLLSFHLCLLRFLGLTHMRPWG